MLKGGDRRGTCKANVNLRCEKIKVDAHTVLLLSLE